MGCPKGKHHVKASRGRKAHCAKNPRRRRRSR